LNRPIPSPASRTNIALLVLIAFVAAVSAGSIAFGTAYVFQAFSRRTPSAEVVQPGPVSGTTSLSSSRGPVVYADDFGDPASGWPVGSTTSGTTASYSDSGYVVVGKGTFHHVLKAPYSHLLTQVGISATATQSTDAPAKAGFGVNCVRVSGSAMIRYEFLVLTPGVWYLERFDSTPGSNGRILRQGVSPAKPGKTPVTLVGMCADLAGGRTTRLALFVNGSRKADYVDYSGRVDLAGWTAGVTTASREPKPSTVTFTHFEEHDLAG
jgi:hypothetical protein